MEELTPILQMRTAWFVLPLVASMVMLAATSIERLLGQHRVTVLATEPYLGRSCSSLAQRVMLGCRGVLVRRHSFSRWALLSHCADWAANRICAAFRASLHYSSNSAPMVVLANTTVSGISSFVLLASLLYLRAMIMEQGGISLRLVRFIHALVGHFRGGLLR